MYSIGKSYCLKTISYLTLKELKICDAIFSNDLKVQTEKMTTTQMD